MIPKPKFDKALDAVGNKKHELAEIYKALGAMAGPPNLEDPIEKKEFDALAQASDAVKAAQGHLAAVADKLLAAVVVEAVAKV